MTSLVASARTCTHPNRRKWLHSTCTRMIASTSSASKAIPFFLNTPSYGSQQQQPTLRMIMFGKPGAGKGTLSARLVRKYDILTLSTGDLLRAHIASGTEMGKLAEGIVSRGELMPDEIVLRVVTAELESLKDKHWILDGFPRTLGQGELLDAHLKAHNTPLSLIVNLDVPDAVILDRIADRWTHLPSGRVYNLSYNHPKVAGLDDVTGEKLVRRADDTPEIFTRRLSQFHRSTRPLLAYYASPARSAPLATLAGETSDEIWPQLEAVVRGSFPALKERGARRPQRHQRHHLGDAILVAEEDSGGVREGVREGVRGEKA